MLLLSVHLVDMHKNKGYNGTIVNKLMWPH